MIVSGQNVRTKKPAAFMLISLVIAVLIISWPGALPHKPSFALGTDMAMSEQINNSLDYLMQNNLTYLTNPHEYAEWVISKRMLGASIDNIQQIIDYLNSEQDYEGAWSGWWTRAFTSHRVLFAYFCLDAKPTHSLETFFANYRTWALAQKYISHETRTDLRDMYHVIFAWILYYFSYPPWLGDFFNEVETDLSWTNSSDFHKRTHILYSYVIARRAFPNLDGIVNVTINSQMPDGHWEMEGTSPRPVYSTSIQTSLLGEILELYPEYRTDDIAASMNRTRIWLNNSYHTQVLGGQVCGYFGDSMVLEDALLSGILCGGVNGLLSANADLTFQDVVDHIVHESPNVFPHDLILIILPIFVIFVILPILLWKLRKARAARTSSRLSSQLKHCVPMALLSIALRNDKL